MFKTDTTMRVPIYIVKFQSQHWDLPPWVWETVAVFLDKSQAIAYVKDNWQDKDPNLYTYSISKQFETSEGILHKLLYKYEGSTLIKCSE